MKILIGNSRTGRTTDLIKLADRNNNPGNRYIVCFSHYEAGRVHRVARKLGCKINLPITYEDLPISGLQRITHLLFDNLEFWLNSLCGHAKLEALTLESGCNEILTQLLDDETLTRVYSKPTERLAHVMAKNSQYHQREADVLKLANEKCNQSRVSLADEVDLLSSRLAASERARRRFKAKLYFSAPPDGLEDIRHLNNIVDGGPGASYRDDRKEEKPNLYDTIQSLTSKDREEIHRFAMQRSEEMMRGDE